MIKVIVVDKTDQIMSSLSAVKQTIVGFNDEIKALNAIEDAEKPVILLHQNVRCERTVDYINALLKVNPTCKIVVIASDLRDAEVLDCLLAGANGYQNIKELSHYAEKLVKVIDAGEGWITRRMTTTLLDALRQ